MVICNPLLFFIILVSVWLIVILFSNTPNKGQMIIQTIIWGIILGVFIYYFCSIGKLGWAWFVFLPLIISAIIMALFLVGFSLGMGFAAGQNAQDIMNYFTENNYRK
jgi:hypothetical protein